MKTWFDWIQQRLDLPWLDTPQHTVPFGVVRGEHSWWQLDDLSEKSDSLTLRAHNAAGLKAQWNATHFQDTREFECWGEIENDGPEPIPSVLETLTLDVYLPGDWGQAWLK